MWAQCTQENMVFRDCGFQFSISSPGSTIGWEWLNRKILSGHFIVSCVARVCVDTRFIGFHHVSISFSRVVKTMPLSLTVPCNSLESSCAVRLFTVALIVCRSAWGGVQLPVHGNQSAAGLVSNGPAADRPIEVDLQSLSPSTESWKTQIRKMSLCYSISSCW